jgi:hypothetical protein
MLALRPTTEAQRGKHDLIILGVARRNAVLGNTADAVLENSGTAAGFLCVTLRIRPQIQRMNRS